MSLAANTVDYYKLDNSPNGTNYNLTVNGTVPYVSTPTPPTGNTKWAGTFSTVNYFTGAAGLCTAFSSLGAWTVELQVYFNTLNSGVMFATNNANVFFQVQADGSVRFGSAGGDVLTTAAAVITTGSTFNMAATWDGTNKRIWVGNTQKAINANSGSLGAITTMYIGRYSANFPVDGYMGQVRLSSVARTMFPTSDLVTASAILNRRRGRR